MTFHDPIYISKAVSSSKPTESCKNVWQNNKIICSNVSRYGRLWKAHIKPTDEHSEGN
jgi:hypothetical protein